MKRLYDNKDTAAQIRKLEIRGQMERTSVIGWIFIVIGLIIMRKVGYLKQIVTDMASIISSGISILGIGGVHIAQHNDPYKRRLERDIEKETDRKCSIDSLNDIEVIPTKIRVGEDLEAINIVPILQDGYYLVLKSRPSSFVLRQLEVDGKNNVDVLENEEMLGVLDDLAVESEFVRKNMKVLKKNIEENKL